MHKALVDTDIVLDLLTERKTFYPFAAKLFTLADQHKIKLCITSLTFANLYYLLSKEHTSTKARKILIQFKTLVRTLPVDDKIIELSLASDFKDFEDGVQYFAAVENGITTIITRNLKDFKPAKIAVLTAEGFIGSL